MADGDRNRNDAPNRSITCSNIPDAFVTDRVILKRHFARFGSIRSITLRPRQRVCTVEFDSAVAAADAILVGYTYDGHTFDIAYTAGGGAATKSRHIEQQLDPDVQMELNAMLGEAKPVAAGAGHRLTAAAATANHHHHHHSASAAAQRNGSPTGKQPRAAAGPTAAVAAASTTVSSSRSAAAAASHRNGNAAAAAAASSSNSPLRSKKPAPAASNNGNSNSDTPPPVAVAVFSAAQRDELESLMRRPAHTAEDKFRVLDARDKLIRLTTRQTTDLANAVSARGLCPDLCPEKERHMREATHHCATFEHEPFVTHAGKTTLVFQPALALKQYSRSSADQEFPLAHELRPEPVLRLCMSLLLHRVVDLCDVPDTNLADWFHFVWDRTRSIRKDVSQQELCSLGAVRLVEQCARLHVHCAGRLVAEEPQVFDSKINSENLTKCLQSLKYLYHDLHLREVRCPNEPEFRAYVILLNLNDCQFFWELKQLPAAILHAPEVRFALQVYMAIETRNYVRFFRLVRQTTYMNGCILLRYFTQMRLVALQTMLKAYATGRAMRLSYWQYVLAFEDAEQTAQFFEYYGLRCDRDGDSVRLDRASFFYPDTPFWLERAVNVVELKRECTVGQAIWGADCEMPAFEERFAAYRPHDSFDANGLLRPEAWLAEDQNFYEPSAAGRERRASVAVESERERREQAVAAAADTVEENGGIVDEVEAELEDFLNENAADNVHAADVDAEENENVNDYEDEYPNDNEQDDMYAEHDNELDDDDDDDADDEPQPLAEDYEDPSDLFKMPALPHAKPTIFTTLAPTRAIKSADPGAGNNIFATTPSTASIFSASKPATNDNIFAVPAPKPQPSVDNIFSKSTAAPKPAPQSNNLFVNSGSSAFSATRAATAAATNIFSAPPVAGDRVDAGQALFSTAARPAVLRRAVSIFGSTTAPSNAITSQSTSVFTKQPSPAPAAISTASSLPHSVASSPRSRRESFNRAPPPSPGLAATPTTPSSRTSFRRRESLELEQRTRDEIAHQLADALLDDVIATECTGHCIRALDRQRAIDERAGELCAELLTETVHEFAHSSLVTIVQQQQAVVTRHQSMAAKYFARWWSTVRRRRRQREHLAVTPLWITADVDRALHVPDQLRGPQQGEALQLRRRYRLGQLGSGTLATIGANGRLTMAQPKEQQQHQPIDVCQLVADSAATKTTPTKRPIFWKCLLSLPEESARLQKWLDGILYRRTNAAVAAASDVLFCERHLHNDRVTAVCLRALLGTELTDARTQRHATRQQLHGADSIIFFMSALEPAAQTRNRLHRLHELRLPLDIVVHKCRSDSADVARLAECLSADVDERPAHRVHSSAGASLRDHTVHAVQHLSSAAARSVSRRAAAALRVQPITSFLQQTLGTQLWMQLQQSTQSNAAMLAAMHDPRAVVAIYNEALRRLQDCVATADTFGECAELADEFRRFVGAADAVAGQQLDMPLMWECFPADWKDGRRVEVVTVFLETLELRPADGLHEVTPADLEGTLRQYTDAHFAEDADALAAETAAWNVLHCVQQQQRAGAASTINWLEPIRELCMARLNRSYAVFTASRELPHEIVYEAAKLDAFCTRPWWLDGAESPLQQQLQQRAVLAEPHVEPAQPKPPSGIQRIDPDLMEELLQRGQTLVDRAERRILSNQQLVAARQTNWPSTRAAAKRPSTAAIAACRPDANAAASAAAAVRVSPKRHRPDDDNNDGKPPEDQPSGEENDNDLAAILARAERRLERADRLIRKYTPYTQT